MLDSKIQSVKDHFGVAYPEDWRDIEPTWILSIPGVGPVTLEHIRIYLAARDLTLKDDQTPEYWRQNLSAARIGHTMGDKDEPTADVQDVCPFTILVDSQEKAPWSFTGIRSDVEDGARPLIVPTKCVSLGAGQGDYQLEAFRGKASIERKSMSDGHGTLLGWGERRERFERELETLNQMEFGAVVVECGFRAFIDNAPQWGKKSAAENRKLLFRTVLSFQQRFRGVQWVFADGDEGRRFAEVTAFRMLEKFWREKRREAKKRLREEKAAALAAVRAEGGCD